MKARLIGVDAPEWLAFVAHNLHDVYHLPIYASVCARQVDGSAAAVLVEEGSHPRLLLPLTLLDLGNGRRDALTPYGYSGPITDRAADAGFVGAAMTAAIACLRSEGIVSLFARLHPLIPVEGLDAVGTLVRHGETVVIDLSLTESEMWHQTRQNHRRDIARSQRAGHEFAFETSPGAFGAFKQIYRATMGRLDAAPAYWPKDEYFDELQVLLGRRLHLATLRVDGNIAAAGLFTESCGIVQLHLAGWDGAYAKAQPTKSLYHGVRTWAKRRGSRWFHLGGGVGAKDDSLFHFKAGFSPLRREFCTLRVVIREQEYRGLAASRGLDAEALDMTGFFPAYRGVAPRVLADGTLPT